MRKTPALSGGGDFGSDYERKIFVREGAFDTLS